MVNIDKIDSVSQESLKLDIEVLEKKINVVILASLILMAFLY